jgi:hypothetical protein
LEFADTLIFQDIEICEAEMNELKSDVEEIIENPYKDWMVEKKTKIRYNFA